MQVDIASKPEARDRGLSQDKVDAHIGPRRDYRLRDPEVGGWCQTAWIRYTSIICKFMNYYMQVDEL